MKLLRFSSIAAFLIVLSIGFNVCFAAGGGPLKYGNTYHIQNAYSNWGSYLDTCDHASCGDNLYNVSASATPTRASGTGTWEILSASKKEAGSSVLFGDSVYLKNKYSSGSYLDTCGHASCGGNLYNVSTSATPTRAPGTGTWIILSASGKAVGSEVLPDDSVHLKNKYSSGSYLDTCGHASCGGNLYNVSTSATPNREPGTGTWRFKDRGTHFYVSKIDLKAPNWVPKYEYTYKVVVTISFSRAVDKNSFKAPGTVNIDLKGMSYGKTASSITGTFRFSGDSKTVVLISDKTLEDLINPQAAENVKYTITLVGTDAGAGVITDSAGEALDGNADDKPGGNYSKVLKVVG